MTLSDQLNEARARVAQLERDALVATCKEFGAHRWVSIGGVACGRCDRMQFCSLPVHECSVCGACDYGENDEADRQIAACECSGDH